MHCITNAFHNTNLYLMSEKTTEIGMFHTISFSFYILIDIHAKDKVAKLYVDVLWGSLGYITFLNRQVPNH